MFLALSLMFKENGCFCMSVAYIIFCYVRFVMVALVLVQSC